MGNPTPAELFEHHHLPIYRYLRRMTRDGQLAEDLTQETFLRVVRAPEAYEERGLEAAWLFTIARNLLRDHLRRRSRRPAPAEAEPEGVASLRPRQHLAASLEEALGGLDEAERDVFLLRELGGLGYREIARVTGSSPDAVRSRIHRARLSLRDALSSTLVRARTRAGMEARR